MSKGDQITCSFCGKAPNEVRKLIASDYDADEHPAGLAICDGCVAFCVGILEEDLGGDWNRSRPS